MAGRPPERRGPALGALDGIKRDIKAAKEGGGAYDPRGVGTAWSHNFLNQKPWHPLNFRNQARVYEAEQEHFETEKRKAEAKAEFEAEQEYLKTLSLLSPEEQEKYRQRQSVSWLYMRPPGYDAALERAEQEAREKGEAGAPGAQPAGASAPAPPAQQQQQPQGQKGGRDGGRGAPSGGQFVSKMIGAFKAGQEQDGLELKKPLGGRSPPRGATSLDAPNQQFVLAELGSDEEEEALRLAAMPQAERAAAAREAARAARRRAEAAEEVKLEQAKAFLRAAGLALPDDGPSGSGSSSGGSGSGSSGEEGSGQGKEKRRKRSSKHKRKGKHKKKKSHRKEKRRRT